jgi:hypothetical protein
MRGVPPEALPDHSMSTPRNLLLVNAAFAAFFGGFVALGAMGLRGVQFHPPLTEAGALSSIDTDLASSAGLRRGSAKLEACLNLLRAERPVVVLFRGDSSAALKVAQIISVLGWPRQVWLVDVLGGNVNAALDGALKRDPEGIFFVDVRPSPGLGTTIEVGGNIVFVRREGQIP